jgi:parallel beta-helix repeat protein
MFLTMFPVLAYGATYYVAKTGKDSNNGSSGSPFLTINRGLQVTRSGDTLIVRAGIYNETLSNTIPSGVTLQSEVQYGAVLQQSQSCGNVFPIEVNNTDIVIDGIVSDATQVTCGLTQHLRIGPNAARITLQNAELKGGHNTGQASTSHGIGHTGSGIEDVNQFIIVRNTKIHDIGTDGTPDSGTQSYAYYMATSGVLFELNEVYNIGGFAIHMYCTQEGACNNNIIRNNYFHDNFDGILFASGGSDNLFYENLVVNTGRMLHHAALQMGGYGGATSQRNKVWNNTFYNNRSVCIQLGGTKNATVQNNICYANDNDAIVLQNASGSIIDHNLLGTNPLFVKVASNDFHLQAGSPAIKAGIVVLPSQQSNASPPDLGAFQTAAVAQLPAPLRLRLVGNE